MKKKNTRKYQTKPEFKNLSFIFPNGVVEKVLLNKHL